MHSPEKQISRPLTIGLIGGISWESSAEYYRILNQETKRRLGGHHNARSVMLTVDFAEIEELQRQGDWGTLDRIMAAAARQLHAAGADFLLVCANTMHKSAAAIEAAVPIPLLHLADVTAAAIQAAGFRRLGLLATRYTMEQDFYRDRLEKRFGLEVLIPDAREREEIHRVIFEELCQGKVIEQSRRNYQDVIRSLQRRGAEAVILGCTEIHMLIGENDSDLPLFDTAELHAKAAVDLAIRGTVVPLATKSS